jgi:hypothetical protein
MPTTVLPTAGARIRPLARAAPPEERQRLLAYIGAHQRSCSSYLATTRRRATAWSTTNIVSSALAATVAAGPTFGGSTFIDLTQRGLSLPDGLPVGQILCAVVFTITVLATVTANIIRTHDFATKIAAAETCYGTLDAVRVQLQFGALPVARAAAIVAKEISRTPFVSYPTR